VEINTLRGMDQAGPDLRDDIAIVVGCEGKQQA